MLAQARELFGDETFTSRNAELAALTLTSGEIELATQWLRGDLDLDRDKLIDFLVELLLSVANDLATKAAEPGRTTRTDHDIRT
jgi:hypothetical protein